MSIKKQFKKVEKFYKKNKLLSTCIVIFFFSLLFSQSAMQFSIIKTEQWSLFYDDRMKSDQASVAVSDFKSRGWNIVRKIECGDRSYARDSWIAFTSTYGSDPAICLISNNQAPLYSDGPYYWATLIYDQNHNPGSMDGELIYGNSRSYNHDDYTLVKFTIHNFRTVIIVYNNQDWLYGAEDFHRTIWLWVANNAENRDRNWYILNTNAGVVDSAKETIFDVTVDNTPPMITIQSPNNIEAPSGEADTISGIISISGTANDENIISLVEVNVDGGEWQTASGTSSWQYNLDTTTLEDGSHVIVARATDGAGNNKESDTTMIWVWNNKDVPIYDWDAPSISVNLPPYVGGSVRIEATISDEFGIQSVTLKIDDGNEISMQYDSTNDVYYYMWDTTQVAEGRHTLHFKAIDTSGNIAFSVIETSISPKTSTFSWNIWGMILSGIGIVYLSLQKILKKRW